MAQTIKLRRSSTEGKVPTTSQLALGEIAINTFDGRIFFEKNDGSATIQHIVTTNSITTGSIELTSKVTAATLTLSGLSAQNSEATSLMINGSGVVGSRELGTAAFSAATDFLTGHPNISAASSVDNSNGSVIQDVTLDSNGHVTGLASANLDGRYYTETESDTLFTKKLGQGVVSGSAQIADVTLTTAAQTNITSLGTLTSLTVDDITINGSTISDSGDFTLDVGGDIILDADGKDILIKDNGSHKASITMNSNVQLSAKISDEDLLFRGNDGGSTITALTLDMSDAGTAIFNNEIKLEGGRLRLGTTSTGGIIENIQQSGTNQDGTALQIYGGRSTGTGEGGDISFFVSPKGATGSSLNDWYRVLHLEGASTATVEVRGELNLYSASNQASETTALVIADSGVVGSRELGSNAFTSTTITPDGGNADTVDSLHASSFLRSDAVDSAGSKITFSGGLNIPDSTNIEIGTGADFVINDNGSSTFFQSKRHAGEVYFQNEVTDGTNQNVLILGTDTGNTSATYVELRYNNVQRIKTTNDGSDMAGLVNFDGTTQSTSKTTGTVVIDGGVGIAKTLNVGEDVVAYASSDERYKDLITPIENPNEKIKLLSGNTFVWNDKHEVFKGKKDIGVIAQEVEKVLPEIVETRDNGYKAVKYEKIVALLIESNKELIKRVEELESKIK